MIGKTIVNRYVIRKHLGGGSFGDVYEAEDRQTNQIVALKFETNEANPQLPNEYKMYKQLEGMDGIPRVYGLYDYGKSRILAMDQMGPSLESLFRRCEKKFSMKTILMMTDQVLRIIEWVHSCGIIHRDIKPQNFLVGRGALRNKVFLIDFGVSTTYIDPRTGEHAMFTDNNGLVGTAYYVSVNTHLGEQQSRRDDLESIMYMLIRFFKGKLPWQDIKIKSVEERNEKITQKKIQTALDELGQHLDALLFGELLARAGVVDGPLIDAYAHGDADAAVPRVGLELDVGHGAQRHAATHHRHPHGKPADRTVKNERILQIVGKEIAAAQQADAKDKKQQAGNDEAADGHRGACLTHASFLAASGPEAAEAPDAPRVRKRRACSSVWGSLTSSEGLPAAVTRRVWASRKMLLLATVKMLASSCETMTKVVPSVSRSSRMRSSSSRELTGSSPAEGSSRKRISGSRASARARPARLRMPPLISEG